MDRRHFAKAAALVPLGLAVNSISAQDAPNSSNSAQAKEDQNTLRRKQKTAAEYNKHSPIHEVEPFAESLAFVRSQVATRVEPFALDELELGPGPLQQARDWNRAYMMRLPNERLLHNFRVNAGLPSSAAPLGGWEALSSELRGHFVGHYLSAAAMLYASTGDDAVKHKADELVAGLAACQAKLGQGGYLSAFPEELFDRLDRRAKVWAPFYTLHKIMAGLLDMHTHGGSPQALDVVLGMAAWVDRWTAGKSEEHMQDILNTEYGGMNDVLYNLTVITQDDRWARTGDRFTKKKFFNPLAMRQDELKGLHVNTHVPQVIGAARRYGLSSDYRFRDVAEFFWETVTEARTYAPGGSGNTESWLTNANRLALEMAVSSHHQECCCAYNMMKLTRLLFSWTGDARYIDYYERNLYNHRLGTIEPETGLTTYFLSMAPGAWKTLCTEDQTFWCCTGTALEDFAKLNDTIYYNDRNDIYLNLFVSSRLIWKARGIRLNQATKFPESDSTLVTIEGTPSEAWALHVRVPGWTTADPSVRINGQLVPLQGSPGSYLRIKRRWRDGDQIELVMPMRLVAEPLADEPRRQAFLYGPIVLAAQLPRADVPAELQHNQGPEIQELPPLPVPSIVSGGRAIDDWMKADSVAPLTFRTTDQIHPLVFKPLNQSWDRFAVYLNVT